jgi:hypothetical protein
LGVEAEARRRPYRCPAGDPVTSGVDDHTTGRAGSVDDASRSAGVRDA